MKKNIEIEEPLKTEYPKYSMKKQNLPFFETIHFAWRQLPDEFKKENNGESYYSNETDTKRMARLLKKAVLINTLFKKYYI